MEQRVIKLEERLSNIEVRLAIAESNILDIREDISTIKGNTTWILRLIVGAIIGALLGLVLTNGGSIT